MAEAVDNAQQEFWRPPVVQPAPARPLVDACDGCGTEFMVGGRYCHVCGLTRQTRRVSPSGWTQYLEFHNIKRGLGLPVASLAAFVVGVLCLLWAIATGFVYSERNLIDWQAVQLFRIQWLLAAVAAFVAGILLKKPSSPKMDRD